ncbi:MAG: hypothetical protein E7C49_01280 [Clostridium sp.]|nr:hypothetical protein [Clostridium sp.]
MSPVEIVVRATVKMVIIWGSLLIIGLPIAKVSIDAAYEIWKERNS